LTVEVDIFVFFKHILPHYVYYGRVELERYETLAYFRKYN